MIDTKPAKQGTKHTKKTSLAIYFVPFVLSFVSFVLVIFCPSVFLPFHADYQLA